MQVKGGIAYKKSFRLPSGNILFRVENNSPRGRQADLIFIQEEMKKLEK